MMKFSIAILAAAVICLSSCKNGKTVNNEAETTQAPKQEQAAPQSKAEVQAPAVDVVFLANLYCKTTDLDKARVFQGKDTNPLFTIRKDVENNYAAVYANTQYQNSLEFYLWTDKDGAKILGVNLTEEGEKGHNRRSLGFYTYDSRLNMVVACKGLNELFSNKMLSLRRNISKFIIKLPTSPKNEDITLCYWEKKDKEKYNELVFKWDGHTFNL